MPKVGEVVWANFDGMRDVLALFVKEGGDKDVIQAPDGSHAHLAYREPGDRDQGGAGRTWWKT